MRSPWGARIRGIGPAGAVSFALLLAGPPCQGQVTGEIRPSSIIALSGGTTSIGVDIDLGSSGATLGSYGATLTWDPSVLEYLGDSGGGQPPFDDAVVNRLSVSSGLLRFGDASTQGATGRVNVMNVTFRAVATPPATAILDLGFTSLFSAGTYENLGPILQVADGSACVDDFLFDLAATEDFGTILDWNAVSGALSYDVIRGGLEALRDDGTSVRLGQVTCLEDDSLDTTTGGGAEPPNPDTALPAVGRGFFYLVRPRQAAGNQTYGFPVPCARERIPDSGDCP